MISSAAGPNSIQPGDCPTGTTSPRTHFEIQSIEGTIEAGDYTIHVHPRFKVYSRRSYRVLDAFVGILKIDIQYLFPCDESVRIGLDRKVGNEVEKLTAIDSAGHLSQQIAVYVDYNIIGEYELKFQDTVGNLLKVRVHWWRFVEGNQEVVEARITNVQDAPKIQYCLEVIRSNNDDDKKEVL